MLHGVCAARAAAVFFCFWRRFRALSHTPRRPLPRPQVDEAVLSAEQKSALPPLGAKPLFLIYKVRRRRPQPVPRTRRRCLTAPPCLTARLPLARILALAPPHRQQCVLLAKISGVSAPELEATIVDNLPALPAEAS